MLGKGAHGNVFLALNLDTGQLLVVKEINSYIQEKVPISQTNSIPVFFYLSCFICCSCRCNAPIFN